MEAEHSVWAAETEDRGSEKSGADPAGEEQEMEGGGREPGRKAGRTSEYTGPSQAAPEPCTPPAEISAT